MSDPLPPDPSSSTAPPRRRLHPGRVLAVVVALALLAVPVALIVKVESSQRATAQRQADLDPFYTPPSPLPSQVPGTLIRSEVMDGVTVPGGTARRILYVTEQGDGDVRVSGGMVFTPTTPVPAGGRPVLAWAHGTLGQGDACVPSRSANPLGDLDWIAQAMSYGWVVAATDYAGLGTPGPAAYLIGRDEAKDVLNSVRAAAQLEDTATNAQLLVFGHSQGGHSALWTADQAAAYAPELQLVAASAAAPAAELDPLVKLQWDQVLGWAIAPDVVVDWPAVYPDLDPQAVLTSVGRKNVARIAELCIKAAAIEGLVRNKLFKQQMFTKDPTTLPAWAEALDAQSAPVPKVPTLVLQSESDNVILPQTTSKFLVDSCAAGAPLSQMWIDGVTHMQTAIVGGPSVMMWLRQRLEGVPNVPNCAVPPPVAPYAG
ncbi:MAG: lipase family protein [Actinomycetes bacterium]